MDADLYLEIADLFKHRWDPAVLDVLAERPERFRALSRRVQTRIEGHFDDNALGRSLKRLRKAKYIRTTDTAIGRRSVWTYHLTDKGRGLADLYRGVADDYERLRGHDGPDEKPPGPSRPGRAARGAGPKTPPEREEPRATPGH